MNVLDVNVLVPLFRSDHCHHPAAREWWTTATTSGEPFTVPDVVTMGFLRVVTNPRTFNNPDTLSDAWAFIDALTSHPLCLKYVPGPHTLTNCQKVSGSAQLIGPALTDAYIAACAMDYGATVVTFDRDFRKFDNLRVLELS